LGLVPGFISPVGHATVKGGPEHKPAITFIADHSIRSVKNFCTGANKLNVDFINVNLGRDFVIDDFTDLVAVQSGFHCAKCSSQLIEEKAIEAGNIFKLGTKYSEDFDLHFTDEKGQRQFVIMGCYGIGTTRLVGTVVEASHDEKGIIWPKSLAPFLVHIISLGSDETVKTEAERIYQELLKQNIEVLYDDRDESAGKKFNDADLIGVPLRLTISNRTLKEAGVEWKLRAEKDSRNVKLEDLAAEIRTFIA
jgi:prolyl-tRNA synthetase